MFPTPTKRPARPIPQRHRWVDDGLVAEGVALRRLVEQSVAAIDQYGTATKPRRRARRGRRHELHLRRIEIIVANLARAVLDPPETGKLAISTRHKAKGRTRYDNPAMGKPVPVLLGVMVELDLLSWKNPVAMRGEASSIAPTVLFVSMVVEFGVTLADFGRDKMRETILLTRNDHYLDVAGDRKTTRERINYTDTTATNAMRARMARLNSFLAAADITFIDDGQLPAVIPSFRHLRRHFNLLKDQPKARFDQGGRLSGGFWMNLKSDRRRHIRINGEPVAVLDYGSMFTRLAYAEIGATAPEGDLYAVPGLEGYRSGVKKAMNCLLFDIRLRRGWPRDIGIGVGNDREAGMDPTSEATKYDARLPDGFGVKNTKKAILRHHPALAPAWGRGLGYKLMYAESQVLLSVLDRLMDQGIPALGLHDSVFVPRSSITAATTAMEVAARTIAGVELPVAVKDDGWGAVVARSSTGLAQGPDQETDQPTAPVLERDDGGDVVVGVPATKPLIASLLPLLPSHVPPFPPPMRPVRNPATDKAI